VRVAKRRYTITNTALYISLSDPGHTDTSFVDKTKPHDPQGWSQTENALFLFTATHGALHEARSALFVAIILFKTVHYWTAILPE